MKHNFILAALASFLFPAVIFAQYQPYFYVDVDVQQPGEQFVIDRTYMGNNTYVAVNIFDNDVPVTNLSDITFHLYYARSQYATSGVAIAHTSISSNTVFFLGAGDVFFEPYDNYWVSVVGVDTAMLTRTYGTGTMIQDYDPLTYTPVTVVGKTPWNWGLVGPYTGIWPIYSYDTNSLEMVNTTSGLYFRVNAGAIEGISNYYTKAESDSAFATNDQWAADVATATANMATGGQWAADIASAVGAVETGGGVTNIGAGLTGNGLDTPLAVDTSVVATGGQWNASIAAFMPGSVISNQFLSTSTAAAVYQPVGAYAVNGQNITGRWFAVGNTNSGSEAFIGGGDYNVASESYSVVSGGQLNYARGYYSTIGGGGENSATGTGSTVSGGQLNHASKPYATVGGGSGNKANEEHSTVGGGYGNKATHPYATVGGGSENFATGIYATVAGGLNNIASDYSFAAGVGARATNEGSFVFSGPDAAGDETVFGSRGDNTFNVRSVGGVYFLAPDLWIKDTNGNTIARFSATNTTISGDLDLTGYASTAELTASTAGASNLASTLHIAQGVSTTNAQVTASNALASAIGVGLVATNLHLAQGAIVTQAVNGVVAVGLVATNAAAGVVAVGAVASNAVPWLGLTGAVHAITITNTPNYTTIPASTNLNMNELRITNLWSLQFKTNFGFAGPNSLSLSNNNLAFVGSSPTVRTVYDSGNFNASAYLTIAAYQAAITNSLQIYSGVVTQDQIGVLHRGFYSGTNLWIPVGGTNWLRFGGVLNAW
jgi:hypothetical protein